jgi:hypothetical protein
LSFSTTENAPSFEALDEFEWHKSGPDVGVLRLVINDSMATKFVARCESCDRCRAVPVADTNFDAQATQLGGVADAAWTPHCKAIETPANQCLLSSMTTTAVGSGSSGVGPVTSLQLPTFTTRLVHP